MTDQSFHIGDILSITTGRLVSPAGIGGVYKILNYMTGDNLFTHQLPRASHQMRPLLLEQHPQLASVNSDNVTVDNWKEWLSAQVSAFGEQLPVTPAAEYQPVNPIAELEDMIGTKP